jgi:hypothetical protein
MKAGGDVTVHHDVPPSRKVGKLAVRGNPNIWAEVRSIILGIYE